MQKSKQFLAFFLLLSICLVNCHEKIRMPNKEMPQMKNSFKHQTYSSYYYQKGEAVPVQKSLYTEQNPQFNVTIEKDGNSTKVKYDFPVPSTTSASLANESISEFKFDFNLKGGHPLFDNKIGYVLLAIVLIGALCCAIHMIKICCCAHKKCHKRECVEVLQIQQQPQVMAPMAPQRIQVPQQQQMIPLQQMSYPQPQPQPQAAQQSFVQLNQNLLPVYKPPTFAAQQAQQKMMPMIVQQPRIPLQQQQQMFMQAPMYYQVPQQQYKMMQQQPQLQQGYASGKPVYEDVNSPAGYNYPSVLEIHKQY